MVERANFGSATLLIPSTKQDNVATTPITRTTPRFATALGLRRFRNKYPSPSRASPSSRAAYQRFGAGDREEGHSAAAIVVFKKKIRKCLGYFAYTQLPAKSDFGDGIDY
jgi:hypothetical protein